MEQRNANEGTFVSEHTRRGRPTLDVFELYRDWFTSTDRHMKRMKKKANKQNTSKIKIKNVYNNKTKQNKTNAPLPKKKKKNLSLVAEQTRVMLVCVGFSRTLFCFIFVKLCVHRRLGVCRQLVGKSIWFDWARHFTPSARVATSPCRLLPSFFFSS